MSEETKKMPEETKKIETEEKVVEEKPKVYSNVDFTEKTLYDYLGVNIETTTEDVEKEFNELKKKYDPINDPDNIEMYQDVVLAGNTCMDEPVRNFYDDHAKLSVVLFNCIQTLFPMRVKNPKTYTKRFIYTITAMLILFAIFIMLFDMQSNKYIYSDWGFIFTTIYIIDGMYVIYLIIKTINDIKGIKQRKVAEQDESIETEYSSCNQGESLKTAMIKNAIVILKFALLVILQINILDFFNERSLDLVTVFFPYFAFEMIELVNNGGKLLGSFYAIVKKQEPGSSDLKHDSLLRYTIGCAKKGSACSVKKGNASKKGKGKGKEEEKKASSCKHCVICASIGVFCNIFLNQIYRVTQIILILNGIINQKSNWITLLLPSIIVPFIAIAIMLCQSRNGFVDSIAHKSLKIIEIIVYFFFMTSAVDGILYKYKIINAINFPYFVAFAELLFAIVVVVGLLPFVLKIEEKMKKD